MNVLSLFDGISCCRLALERCGFNIQNYYSAEIDKYAIKITQSNRPDTIQLGNVLGWKNWNINWQGIDLITGGFPCQAWSTAGKQLGDKDERGALFWIMLDIMQYVLKANPNAKFLCENVKMKREFESYITYHTEKALGYVNKVLINSALVSAQNRNRYYWTNINNVDQPCDLGIFLSDIIEDGFVDRDKSYCIDANYGRGGNLKRYFLRGSRQLVFMKQLPRGFNKGFIKEVKKSPTISSCSWQYNNLISTDGIAFRKLTVNECETLQTLPKNWTDGISASQRYKAIGNAWTVDVVAHILSYIAKERNYAR